MLRFPILSLSCNLYLMLAYHYEFDVILVNPFCSKHDRQRLVAYKNIHRRIKSRGHKVNLQVLDNESSAAYFQTIKEELNKKYQMVPPMCIDTMPQNMQS